jgi:hypothetical protein
VIEKCLIRVFINEKYGEIISNNNIVNIDINKHIILQLLIAKNLKKLKKHQQHHLYSMPQGTLRTPQIF